MWSRNRNHAKAGQPVTALVLPLRAYFFNIMEKQIIYSDQTPAPIGPYSQAVKAGGFLFVSGQIAAEMAPQGDVGAETQQVMENIVLHKKHLSKTGGLQSKRIHFARTAILNIVRDWAARSANRKLNQETGSTLLEKVSKGELDPYTAAEKLI